MKSNTVPRGGFPRPMTIGSLQAISHVMQFSLATASSSTPAGSGKPIVVWASQHWFDIADPWAAQPGALVAIWCAPASTWYLSWLVKVTEERPGTMSPRWWLQSLHDGRIASWVNISVKQFDPKVVADHPEWRWTDKQHAFKRRWDKVVYRRRGRLDGPEVVALWPTFGEGSEVTFGVRVKWQDDTPEHTRRATRPNFSKLKIADLRSVLAELIASFPKGAGGV